MQGLSGQREEGFAEGLALGRVGMDEWRDVLGMGLPRDRELSLGDELADTIAEEMDTEDGPSLRRTTLTRPPVPMISLLPFPARLYS